MDKAFLASLQIQKLQKAHDRSKFDCGIPKLNIFLQKHARQNQKQGISVTYVAIEPEENRIVGYYSLSTSSISLELLPESSRKRLPGYPVSFARIGRLARDMTAKGKGVGPFLLIHAFEKIVAISEDIGLHAVEVDAKHQHAREFYIRFGFQELLDDPLHLFITTKTIRKALK